MSLTFSITDMNITTETVRSLILKSFENAWNNKDTLKSNSKRSSYFVSELANEFSKHFGGDPLVQSTNKNGEKSPGEWLLDIVVVNKQTIKTKYKNRDSIIVRKIIWAIESEFSTNLDEFCRDFSKLIFIKASAYLYVAGFNQIRDTNRSKYIDTQIKLSRKIVSEHGIKEPFFIVFIPTPGATSQASSGWDEPLERLKSLIRIQKISKI